MEYMLFAVVMIGCIFAVIEIIHVIVQYILPPKKVSDTITVMPITGRMDDVEYVVRGLLWQKNWSDIKSNGKIILLNLGADDETISVCKNFADENEMVELFTPIELEKYLKK